MMRSGLPAVGCTDRFGIAGWARGCGTHHHCSACGFAKPVSGSSQGWHTLLIRLAGTCSLQQTAAISGFRRPSHTSSTGVQRQVPSVLLISQGACLPAFLQIGMVCVVFFLPGVLSSPPVVSLDHVNFSHDVSSD